MRSALATPAWPSVTVTAPGLVIAQDLNTQNLPATETQQFPQPRNNGYKVGGAGWINPAVQPRRPSQHMV